MRRLILLLPLLALIGLPLHSQPVASTDIRVTGCNRVALSEDARPSYTISGAWLSPFELALVDPPMNRLVRVSTQGRRIGVQSKDVEIAVKEAFQENFLPISIQTDPSGAWLELVGGRLAKLASAERVVATRDLWGTSLDGGAKLIAILGWSVAGSDIFGYGNFELADSSIRTGYFRINLDNPSDAMILTSKPNGDTSQLWYRLGLPFVASIGERGYALRLDDRLALVESSPGAPLRTFGVFTGRLSGPPSLPPFVTPLDFVMIMKKLSVSTAPMGLYAWHGKLYLLWKYNDDSGSEWFISRIDPEKPASKALDARVSLDSEAEHLMIIPGPEYWAFVEKGPVKDYMTQATKSILFAPVETIEAAFVGNRVLCGGAPR